MRRGYAVWQVARSAAGLLLTVAFAPLIMVAGEPLRRYVLARPAARPSRPGWHRTLRRSPPGTPAAVISHRPPGAPQAFLFPPPVSAAPGQPTPVGRAPGSPPAAAPP